MENVVLQIDWRPAQFCLVSIDEGVKRVASLECSRMSCPKMALVPFGQISYIRLAISVSTVIDNYVLSESISDRKSVV